MRFIRQALLVLLGTYVLGIALLCLLPALGATFPFGKEVPWSDAEIVTDRDGRVIVLSRFYGRIMVYDDQGRFQGSWQAFEPGGSGGEELASSRHGEIFHCHSGGGGQTIAQFSPGGQLLRTWKNDGTVVDGWRLTSPTEVAAITGVGGELRSVRRVASAGDVLCAAGWVQPPFTNAAGCRLVSRWGAIHFECPGGDRRLAQKWWLWLLTWPAPAAVLGLLAIGILAWQGRALRRTGARGDSENGAAHALTNALG